MHFQDLVIWYFGGWWPCFYSIHVPHPGRTILCVPAAGNHSGSVLLGLVTGHCPGRRIDAVCGFLLLSPILQRRCQASRGIRHVSYTCHQTCPLATSEIQHGTEHYTLFLLGCCSSIYVLATCRGPRVMVMQCNALQSLARL